MNTTLHFPGQKPGETIQYIVHKHWIIYVRLAGFVLAVAGIPFVSYFFLVEEVPLSPNQQHWLTLLFFLYLILILSITFIRWLEEEMDMIIVTNERIISIDQVTFMHRTISETELSQVQDVKHVAKGLLANLFGFGSLEIQTAAHKVVFVIKAVYNPFEMARGILDLCNTYKKEFAKNHGGNGNGGNGIG